MQNIVIIAEKPEAGKSIARAIDGSRKPGDGYIEITTETASKTFVTWCFGHILQLLEPKDYDEKYMYKNTTSKDLPIFFDNWKVKPTKGAEEQLKKIGNLLKNATLVINAGDIDEEGQLIVDEVLDWHKYTGKAMRLNTSALNEESLRAALKNMEPNNEWRKFSLSARARSVGDFCVGINYSRLFSEKLRAFVSVGRVQTPTLGLVVNRDLAIENHVVEYYYTLEVNVDSNEHANIKDIIAKFVPSKENPELDEDGYIKNRDYLDKIAAAVNGKTFDAVVEKKMLTEQPPLPFNLEDLKVYCSDKFNISPENTLKITQDLREKYKVITYNRSDCRYLPESAFNLTPSIVAAVINNLGNEWNFKGFNPNIKSRAFNDSKVTAHHAIIPTSEKANTSNFTEDELRVYKAICGYYMVQFMPVCEKEKTTLTINGKDGNNFVATSIKITSPGFKSVMKVGNEAFDVRTPLSDVPAGTYRSVISNPNVQEKQTRPPKRYTDATLEKDMSHVAKYVTDPDVKAILIKKDDGKDRENGSIGTTATRSAIIANLKKRGFIKNEGKNIISTDLGREFYRILPDEVKLPDLTAKWWSIQEDIKNDSATPQDLYDDILTEFRRIATIDYSSVDSVKNAAYSLKKNTDVGVCPRCGKPIRESTKSFYCTGYKDGCKFSIWKHGDKGILKVLDDNKKKLTKALVVKLLNGEKPKILGLVSEKTGKKYSPRLNLVDTGTSVYIEFVFDDKWKGRKS